MKPQGQDDGGRPVPGASVVHNVSTGCSQPFPQGDEVEAGLREALERVAQHRPGTPGLHFDSLEKLIESATQVALDALRDYPAAPPVDRS